MVAFGPTVNTPRFYALSQSLLPRNMSGYYDSTEKLEALRERRPPWPRQIITPILPTVKMLSLGGERLRN